MWHDDLSLTLLAGVSGVLLLGLSWAAVASRAETARRVRDACDRLGGMGRVAVSVVALVVFLAVANEVTDGARDDPDEILAQVDHGVRSEVRAHPARRTFRAIAKRVGQATGLGLAVATGLVTAGLVIARRRQEALVVLLGIGTAWLLAQLLKLWFQVPRPGGRVRDWAITGFGFPSAHAMVTVVALGLFAWALGRRLPRGARFALHATVVVVTLLTALSRVVLTVHWTSDVLAGLAVGALWLNLVVATQTWRGEGRKSPALTAEPR